MDDRWMVWFSRISDHRKQKRTVRIKESTEGDDAAIDELIAREDLADFPAPAGGLVPPTLTGGIPGVRATMTNAQRLDWLRVIARTPDKQTLPELRRTFGDEWRSRHAAALPVGLTATDLLKTLLDFNGPQALAQQTNDLRARKRAEANAREGVDTRWMNPLAHHRFGPPLLVAESDAHQESSTAALENLQAWLGQPEGVQRLRAVLYMNLLCVHLAFRADAGLDITAEVTRLLVDTARRLLQGIALHTSDDALGDNAAAIATTLAWPQANDDGYPSPGATADSLHAAWDLPSVFVPLWFAAPDTMVLVARHALPEQHHGWLGATAQLARDTANLITCGLLAPQLGLMTTDGTQGLLLGGLLAHLAGQKDSMRRGQRLKIDSNDPYLQTFSGPMYLHRVWAHLSFLHRAHEAFRSAAARLPRSQLDEAPYTLAS